MSEIAKLYENARVYDFRYDCDVSFKDGNFGRITNCSKGEIKDYCTDKKYFKKAKVINVRHLYPPFTAEKQIELIKWLAIRDELNLYQNKATNDWVFYDHEKDATHYSFEQGLASWINYLWQDLTEEEKQQVKGILE